MGKDVGIGLVTFGEARKIAVEHLNTKLPLDDAAVWAAAPPGWDPMGWEDAKVWHVAVGDARFYASGGAFAYALDDSPEVLVDKKSGMVSLVPFLDDPARFKAMTPISSLT